MISEIYTTGRKKKFFETELFCPDCHSVLYFKQIDEELRDCDCIALDTLFCLKCKRRFYFLDAFLFIQESE